jgi:hypothetical protein
MKIFKYQQWLEESEEVAPAPAAPAPSTDTLPEIPADQPAGDMPVDASAEIPADLPAPTEEIPVEGEMSEYDQIDAARKDAIRAFKAKYDEFKNAPEDQKETMKDELKSLYDAMKEAVDKFDELVGKEIGAELAPEIEDEP